MKLRSLICFRLVPETVTPPVTEYDLFWSDVTFTGTMHSNDTIHIVYIDSNSSTVDTQIYLYEIYNGTPRLLIADSRLGENSFVFWNASINISRMHSAVLYFNNTANYGDVTSPVSIIIHPINITSARDRFDLEARIEGMFGPGPLGSGSWCPLIAITPALFVLVSFGPFNTGGAILGCGLMLGFTSAIFSMVLTNPFPTVLLAAIGFFIAIGVIYMWAKDAGGHL